MMNFVTRLRLMVVLLVAALFCSGCDGCGGTSAPPSTNGTTSQTERQTETPKAAVVPVTPAADNKKNIESATLIGKFVVDGKVPQLPPRKCTGTQVPGYCCKLAGNAEEQRIIVGKNNELADVMVYIRGPVKNIDPAILEATAKQSCRIDNVNCTFTPHTTFMCFNQKLTVRNLDKDPHNIKLDTSPSHNDMIPPGESKEYPYTINSVMKRPYKYSCGMHTWMEGNLFICDHPFGIVTKNDGTFEIKEIPAGQEFEFQFWHEWMGFIGKVKFKGGEANEQGRFKMKLKPGVNDLGTINIPAETIPLKE